MPLVTDRQTDKNYKNAANDETGWRKDESRTSSHRDCAKYL
jgi:hypothetical protein